MDAAGMVDADVQTGYERFYSSLADHYRAGRDNSEECLGDVVKILSRGKAEDPNVLIIQILDRLARHYKLTSARL
jgi:hypothetical protein